MNVSSSNTAIADPLDACRIRECLAPAARNRLRELTILAATDSTNSELLRRSPNRRHAHVVLAETQTRGRGRRQRHWHSPAGGNIYLSLGWRLGGGDFLALPLLTGVCVCAALDRAGLAGHGIKWPNDVLVGGAKLAGILVETQSAGSGPVDSIIGVGLNVRMPDGEAGSRDAAIGQPWTDLVSNLPAQKCDISRNQLISMLLEELLSGLERFEATGFESFRGDWRRLDLLHGRRIRVAGDGHRRTGVARGIDGQGRLRVEFDDGGLQVLHSAEVSVYDD